LWTFVYDVPDVVHIDVDVVRIDEDVVRIVVDVVRIAAAVVRIDVDVVRIDADSVDTNDKGVRVDVAVVHIESATFGLHFGFAYGVAEPVHHAHHAGERDEHPAMRFVAGAEQVGA
jgi:hypothetical protein